MKAIYSSRLCRNLYERRYLVACCGVLHSVTNIQKKMPFRKIILIIELSYYYISPFGVIPLLVVNNENCCNILNRCCVKFEISYNTEMDILTITPGQARKFLVAYHGLDRYSTYGKERSIMDFFQKVGSVQFDPLDVCGKNAELVLQSRVKKFRPSDLYNLLYKKRLLTEGWDKMMCIYNMSDYPYFQSRRDRDKVFFNSDKCLEIRKISNGILEEIKEKGPLSSLDLDFQKKIDWSWAPAKLSRAALESLFFAGFLGIESRIHSRRKYDLVENLVPKHYLEPEITSKSDIETNDWQVKRRIASLGMYYDKSGDGWLGMIKKSQRDKSISRLISTNDILPLKINGIDFNFYIPSEEKELLDLILSGKRKISRKISFLAPLDNFMWDRKLIELLFHFKYRWEVYKPKKERQYGYYVLPVLYGDKIIGRFEPIRDKKNSKLIIKNWWWEEDIIPDEKMLNAINKAIIDFAYYLEVEADLSASPYQNQKF